MKYMTYTPETNADDPYHIYPVTMSTSNEEVYKKITLDNENYGKFTITGNDMTAFFIA